MRKCFTAVAAAALLAFAAPAALALDAGEKAPEIVGREFVNTGPISLAQLEGRVVFVEVFRTW